MPTNPEPKRDSAVRIPLPFENAVDGLLAVTPAQKAQMPPKKSVRKPTKAKKPNK